MAVELSDAEVSQPAQIQPRAELSDADVSTPATTGRPVSADQYMPASVRSQSQSLGNVSPYTPAAATGTQPREDQVPGPVVQGAGSLATDPEQRRRIIAGQLFPNLDPHEAQLRVTYGVGGRLVAVGQDGKAFYVDPAPYAPTINQPSSLIPDAPLSRVGGLIGPSLPAAGGIGGGAAAGPTSLVFGPLGAGVGAAMGDALRQYLARQLDPGIPGPQGAPPTPQPYNLRQMASETLGAAGGQAAGASILRVFAPNRLALTNTELRQLRRPGVMDAANQTYDTAQTGGVTLTPGQATGLPSLLAKEDVLSSGSAGSDNADIAATFYGGQRQQLNQLYQDYLDKVSPASDKTDAAMQFQQGTEDATRIVRQDANAAARPAYQQAQAGGQVMSPDLAQLMDLPATKTALQDAAVDYQNRTGKVANIDAPDFDLWNITKIKLDEQVNKARQAGDYSNADAIGSVRDRLRDNLDAAYPSYQTARDLAAPGQRLAARLQASLGPPGTGDETARQATAGIFGPGGINPRAVAEARDAFAASGRTDEWQAGTRAYLQDLFDTASKGPEGLNPANLRKAVWGDPNTRAAMQAALTPEQFQGLDNVMGTLEAVARSKGMNSLTAPRTVGRQELLDTAGSTAGVRGVRFLGAALSPSSYMQGFKPAADSLANWMTTRNVGKFASQIFGNPDLGLSPGAGMNFLREAANLAPGSRELITRTGEFLGQQQASSSPPLMGPRNQMAPDSLPSNYATLKNALSDSRYFGAH